VPLDDPATFAMIRTTRTLGCFQIESPGQRELIGKLAPTVFDDLIIDISLFRPGPVKSDMIRPFLEARPGWSRPQFLHDRLVPAVLVGLEPQGHERRGEHVVVADEQEQLDGLPLARHRPQSLPLLVVEVLGRDERLGALAQHPLAGAE